MAPPKDDPKGQDDDKDDDDEDEESPPEKPSTTAAKDSAEDDDDDDDDAEAGDDAEDEEDDDDEDDEDEDEEEEAKPAAKPAAAAGKKAEPAKAAAKPVAAKAGAVPSKPKPSAVSKGPTSKRAVRARPRGTVAATPVAQRKKGSLVTSMILFVIVVGGLATGFAILGRETGGTGPTTPKWNVGSDVDLEVTLVASDQKDLGCAAAAEVAGRHCAFEAQTKPWSKSTDTDETKLLRPYTTTNQIQFLGAGLWSEPAMKGKLPPTRFTVKCKYKVEGKMKKPSVRWSSEGPWYDRPEDWYSGQLHDCSVVP